MMQMQNKIYKIMCFNVFECKHGLPLKKTAGWTVLSCCAGGLYLFVYLLEPCPRKHYRPAPERRRSSLSLQPH